MIQSRSCACYASVCQRDQTLSLTDCPCTSSSHHRLLNATIAPVHMKRYLPKCVLFFLCRLYLYLRCRDSTQKPVIQCVSRSVCVCLQTQRAQHHSPSTTNTSHPSWENGPHQHDYKCREMHATPANPFSHAAPIHSNINLKALLLLRCHILFNVQLCEVSEQAGHAKWSSPSECMGVCNTLAAGSFKLFLLIRENK